MTRGRVPTGRRRATRRARAARFALIGVVAVVAGACGSGDGLDEFRTGPAFHSAGPATRLELEAVLQSQAELIAAGNWDEYYELYVPTERQRCSSTVFGIFAERTWAPLREQTTGMKLAARVVDVKVNGFRASVVYRLVVQESDLTTPESTNRYLKLGDRWFIEEQAC